MFLMSEIPLCGLGLVVGGRGSGCSGQGGPQPSEKKTA